MRKNRFTSKRQPLTSKKAADNDRHPRFGVVLESCHEDVQKYQEDRDIDSHETENFTGLHPGKPVWNQPADGNSQ